MIINILGINCSSYMIILLLEGGEGGVDLALLIRKKECLRRIKFNFILVFLGHLPLIL